MFRALCCPENGGSSFLRLTLIYLATLRHNPQYHYININYHEKLEFTSAGYSTVVGEEMEIKKPMVR
jgi:hypothetical protein